MGNDGGFIPTRDCLAKEKPREVNIDAAVKARSRARLCALSMQRLKQPIAMCRLGYLYNYGVVIQHLMEKNMPARFAHIQRSRDVKEIRMEANEDKTSENPFTCPLSRVEFNGHNKFVALWTCGCAFSEKLLNLETLGSDNGRSTTTHSAQSKSTADAKSKNCEQVCPVCAKSFTRGDVVSLNNSEEEMARQQRVIMHQQDKKSKKKSHKAVEDTDEANKKKKVKNESEDQILDMPKVSLIQKLVEKETENVKQQSEAFNELFHKDQKEEVGFFRNVRHGIR